MKSSILFVICAHVFLLSAIEPSVIKTTVFYLKQTTTYESKSTITISVRSRIECFVRCRATVDCLAVNVETKPANQGVHCELMILDRKIPSKIMISSTTTESKKTFAVKVSEIGIGVLRFWIEYHAIVITNFHDAGFRIFGLRTLHLSDCAHNRFWNV